MIELHEITHINAPRRVVWAAIHDYTTRMQWDTLLRRVAVDGQPPENANPITVGTEVTQWSRWRAGDVKMIARYDKHVPPAEGQDGVAIVNMVKGPWFFRSFRALAVLQECDDGSTQCEATYTFDCRPAALQWIVNRVVIWMFQRETAARWKSMQKHIESNRDGS